MTYTETLLKKLLEPGADVVALREDAAKRGKAGVFDAIRDEMIAAQQKERERQAAIKECPE